tara:strand:- start:241 stop:504 length:264 start_codon:yes stop_codon:yes gene_type:complete
MKPGDLVTLSERALNLETCFQYRKDVRAGKVAGLLKEIVEKDVYWRHGVYYIVEWIGPKYKKIRRSNSCMAGHFKRSDLKMYKAPKK